MRMLFLFCLLGVPGTWCVKQAHATAVPSTTSAVWYAGSAPITVDGDLSDWNPGIATSISIPHRCALFSKSGTESLRASFRILADYNYVYVAVTGAGDFSGKGRFVDIQVYGSTTLNKVRYQKFRGIDGSISISAGAGGVVLGGSVRLPSDAEAGQMLECPRLWDLLGAKAGLKRSEAGFTAEVAIPIDALGWQPGSPPGQLRLNVRVFGRDEQLAPVARQWADDPLNTSETSHELLGKVSFSPVLSTQVARPQDTPPGSVLPILRQIASGRFAEAISALLGASDARALPLLSVAYLRAGQPEAARALLQQLAVGRTSDPVRTWATAHLEQPGLAEGAVDSEIARLIEQGTRLSGAGRWAEAVDAFRRVADSKASSIKDSVWAMLQVQKCQLSAGAIDEATVTGWTVQRTAPDGDPNRRESLDRIMTTYFSNSEGLKRAERASKKHEPSGPLYALYFTQLRARGDGIGCWQELELGELMRMEGASQLAQDHYRAASEMLTCPRVDRAWALLLLQRVFADAGQAALGISIAQRINADYPDEWDIRSASLAEASALSLTRNQTQALNRAVAEFRADLLAQPVNTSAESRHARSVLGEFDQALRSSGNKELR